MSSNCLLSALRQAIVNNSPNCTSPRSPLHGSASDFDRRGARAKGSQPAPLLVLTRLGTNKPLIKSNSHRVTPLLAQRYPLSGPYRVTVTFGAHRVDNARSILLKHGYNILTAADGAEAVALFAEQQDRVHLVLTDIMMPRMEGFALIRALRKIDPALKIIAGRAEAALRVSFAR